MIFLHDIQSKYLTLRSETFSEYQNKSSSYWARKNLSFKYFCCFIKWLGYTSSVMTLPQGNNLKITVTFPLILIIEVNIWYRIKKNITICCSSLSLTSGYYQQHKVREMLIRTTTVLEREKLKPSKFDIFRIHVFWSEPLSV